VTVSASDLPLAVLDTSFWTNGYRAEVIANCFDLFQIVVPREVEGEILAPQTGAPTREYPYATLFRHLRSRMLDPPDNAPSSLGRFGAGEAAAITLAQALDASLLINERRAAAYAESLGIAVVTVPAVIVALRLGGIISDRAARRKLELIEENTAQRLVVDARRVLDRLALADDGDTEGS
jgi:predicted nucleic acid-binding protein